MTSTSGIDRETNMQREMETKRKRTDSDVAGSTRTKSQRTGNISHSNDPSNNMQQEVSVRKRRASDDGEMPRKKMRCVDLTSSSDPIETGLSVEDPKVEAKKRKASDDGEEPQKKRRCSSSTTSTTSSTSSSTTSTTSSSSGVVSSDPESSVSAVEDSDEDGAPISYIFNNASAEEEWIFEMSSTGNTSRADFEDRYWKVGPLGAGGFGSVFAGIRKSDCLPVAIKYIPSEHVVWEKVMCNGKGYNVILEVALMLTAAGLPGTVGQSYAVSLLDWYILDQKVILVMERPAHCMDLYKYLVLRGGSLYEFKAKMILRQLVDAAIDMHSKGVFHRDIKLQNVLVEDHSGTPTVRIIDFGCGCFSTETSFHSFCGTRSYFPPEWLDYHVYWAYSTTVWQLGALFYSLLSGHEPFTTKRFIQNRIQINSALSQEVQTLLHMCLARNPMDRVSLGDLQLHLAH